MWAATPALSFLSLDADDGFGCFRRLTSPAAVHLTARARTPAPKVSSF